MAQTRNLHSLKHYQNNLNFVPVSIFVIDKAGRRILLLISGIVMAMPLATLGAFFYVFSDHKAVDHDLHTKLEWIPLFCLVVYMIGYSIGYACVPYLLLGEMLPGQMRNVLGAFVSAFNLLMIFMTLKLFPAMTLSIGFHGLFWIYAIFSLIGAAFGFFCIPETKGKTLEEIEAHFSKSDLTKLDNPI